MDEILNIKSREDLIKKLGLITDGAFQDILDNVNSGNYKVDVVEFHGDEVYSITPFAKLKECVYNQISIVENFVIGVITMYPNDTLIEAGIGEKLNWLIKLDSFFDFLDYDKNKEDEDLIYLISLRKEMTAAVSISLGQLLKKYSYTVIPDSLKKDNRGTAQIETFRSLFKQPDDELINSVLQEYKGCKLKVLAFLIRALAEEGLIYLVPIKAFNRILYNEFGCVNLPNLSKDYKHVLDFDCVFNNLGDVYKMPINSIRGKIKTMRKS